MEKSRFHQDMGALENSWFLNFFLVYSFYPLRGKIFNNLSALGDRE
jgi:hypothetical protein